MGYVNFPSIMSNKLIRITQDGNSQYYVHIMNKIHICSSIGKLSSRIQFSRLKYCYLRSVFNNNHDAEYNHHTTSSCSTRYIPIINIFLSSSASNFFSYQEKEDTLLIHAARLGKEDVVDLLLLAGAHIEATNKVTKTVKLGYVY